MSSSTWQHPRSTCPPLAELPAWQDLLALADSERAQPLAARFAADPQRFSSFCVEAGPLLVDFSRERLSPAVLDAFAAVAEGTAFRACRAAQLGGDAVNTTEGRAAHHTRLRGAVGNDDPEVGPVLARMQELAALVRSGTWRGATGKPVRDILHIGIGGSALGPQLVWEALRATHQEGPEVHFVANVDGADLHARLRGLDPETTLCLLVSKSFGTAETLLNARSVRSWLVERGIAPGDLRHHLLAVTTNARAAAEFGIPEDNLLPLWDWVGGRYSLWSSVGASLAMGLGWAGFEGVLRGGAAMDRHYAEAPERANAPLLLALKELWALHGLGAASHAVLAYDHRLRSLPAHLQQVEMESNGKGVDLDGRPLGIPSAAVTWGGEGSNGQHAYHQQLHQGMWPASTEFILAARGDDAFAHQHQWLASHCLAQGQALLAGDNPGDPHRLIPGDRPSSTVLMPALTPETLGALVALYEHKTAAQGMILGLNAFDQFGVELGKTLGDRVHASLTGTAGLEGHDGSTAGLIRQLRAWGATD